MTFDQEAFQFSKDASLKSVPGVRTMQRMAVLAALKKASKDQQDTADSFTETDIFLLGYNTSMIEGFDEDSHEAIGKSEKFETDLHGSVNILLVGAMLSGVIIAVILICYCCHKSMKKQRPQEYSRYWRAETDVHNSLEIFTMDAHARRCESSSAVSNTQDQGRTLVPMSYACPGVSPGPPPAYESLVFDQQSIRLPGDQEEKKSPQDDLTNVVPVSSERNESHEENIESVQARETKKRQKHGEEELPSYEAALKLEADGYV